RLQPRHPPRGGGDRGLRGILSGWRWRHRRGGGGPWAGRAVLTRLHRWRRHARVHGGKGVARSGCPEGGVRVGAQVQGKSLLAANWKMNPVSARAAAELVRGVMPAAEAHK